MKNGILQDWVCRLGLRYQGVLLTVVRGCDTLPKDCDLKTLSRFLRYLILRPHCGDPRKSSSFIQFCLIRDLTSTKRSSPRSSDPA
ncbi:hypothetical protein Pan189_41600 [Stratiformator vulcanicus]|uniref:Uncharacterized protein n=1 Tax=Stratiformator vulcanicus TaxID=2527980 RepID=A0A517R7F7_9PLAN|nr:hypothetical protein Pan189_41600 [Stratiformator vulcanicus]